MGPSDAPMPPWPTQPASSPGCIGAAPAAAVAAAAATANAAATTGGEAGAAPADDTVQDQAEQVARAGDDGSTVGDVYPSGLSEK
jgi:hypothetical protein